MNIKKINRSISITLIILSTLIVGLVSSPQPTIAETVCTKSTRLNVRSTASTSSSIVWKLYKGTYVNVVAYNSNYTWAKISFYAGNVEKTGWISAKYICG